MSTWEFAKKRWIPGMFIALAIAIPLTLIFGEEKPSEEEIYADAVEIMTGDLEDKGFTDIELSSREMTGIQESESTDGMYIVTGNAYVTDSEFDSEYSEGYELRIIYKDGEWTQYEWEGGK